MKIEKNANISWFRLLKKSLGIICKKIKRVQKWDTSYKHEINSTPKKRNKTRLNINLNHQVQGWKVITALIDKLFLKFYSRIALFERARGGTIVEKTLFFQKQLN